MERARPLALWKTAVKGKATKNHGWALWLARPKAVEDNRSPRRYRTDFG